MKRLLDIVLACVGIVLLSPILVAVAVAVLVDSGRPVLFKQERVGRNFTPFHLYKFRSMHVATPGVVITVSGDPRVTRVGRFLRTSKLDELPQLLNVIRGDMSLVGARPEVRRYVDLFPEDYAHVLSVRPGVTSPASLKYRHESELLATSSDPERLYVERILPDKLAIERDYVDHQTLRLDLRIMGATVVAAFRPFRRGMMTRGSNEHT